MSISSHPDIKTLASAIGAKSMVHHHADIPFLLIDSRQQIRNPENTLFVAIRGAHHNGHRFINELIKKGIRNFLVDQEYVDESTIDKSCNYLVVPNCIEGLQQIAGFYLQHLQQERKSNPALHIAITGSNGKTTQKEWLWTLLGKKDVYRSPKSYNSQIGVPLSIWNFKKEDQFGVFEAGISQPGEMIRLQQIIQPHIGILTGIGPAHDEFFTSRIHKLQEKLLLFKQCKLLILPFACQTEAKNLPCHQITWGSEKEANLRLIECKPGSNSTSMDFSYKGPVFELDSFHSSTPSNTFRNCRLKVEIPFTDKASILNTQSSLALLMALNYDIPTIQKRFLELEHFEMRLEMSKAHHNSILINDAYNADLDSLAIALDYLDQKASGMEKVVILSDFQQSGQTKEALYGEIHTLLSSHHIQKVYTVGEQSKELFKMGKLKGVNFKNVLELKSFLQKEPIKNAAILLKGARSFAFEKIASVLVEKAHATRLEINLNAMEHNLNTFRAMLGKKTQMMAMVKAFAYGGGGKEVSDLIQHHKVSYLGVAYTDEGVQLRKQGIQLPIMLMNSDSSSMELIRQFNLEPAIYSLNQFRDVQASLETNEKLNIHLKIETGLHRLGLEKEELSFVLDALTQDKRFHLVTVYSHLAASDNPKENAFTKQQIKVFEQANSEIVKKLKYQPIRHICNTGGISNHPEAHYEMVRLGIGLFGVSGNPKIENSLQSVASFKTRISQIKNLKKGDSVGYNRAFKADKSTSIAVLPVGYADGIPRSMGNQAGSVYIDGTTYPMVGNICMDMCFIHIGNAQLKEGDEVELFGENLSLSDFAKAQNTIEYEVLTHISQRVNRIFYKE